MRRPSLTATVLGALALSGIVLVSGATGDTAPTYPNPATTAQPFRESWADTLHGWRLVGQRSVSGGWRSAQSTENGGRTWHPILSVGRSFEIGLISRVSSNDGFAFVGSKVRTRRNRFLVTTDNGGRWKTLPFTFAGFPIEMSGRDLYWVRPGQSHNLFRAPNALSGHTRKTVVATLPANIDFDALQAIPGGIAALAQGGPDTAGEFSTRVLLYRYGKARTFVIVHSRQPIVCKADIIAFSANWPVLTIGVRQATRDATGELQCNTNWHNAVFVSRDGGKTWTGS